MNNNDVTKRELKKEVEKTGHTGSPLSTQKHAQTNHISSNRKMHVSNHTIKRAMRGDARSMEKIIKVHYNYIFYFSIKKVGIQDAEDVVQMAITRIVDNISSLKEPQKLKSWMMSITNNTCMDYIRKRMQDREHMISQDDFHEEALLSLEDAHREFLPEKAALDNELRSLLVTLIDSLPKNYADCLRLRYHDDMNLSEIAETLDTDYKKIRNDLYNGMSLLKKRFEAKTGVHYRYGATPTAAVPVLSLVMQADCSAINTPDMATRILTATSEHIALTLGGAVLTANAATNATGAAAQQATTNAAGTATQQVATNAAANTAGAAAQQAGAAAFAPKIVGVLAALAIGGTGVAAYVETTKQPPSDAVVEIVAPENPNQTQEQIPAPPAIHTLTDMVGAENAATLETFAETGTTQEAWAFFTAQIGATLERTAAEVDHTYTIHLLEKQDKQLLLMGKSDAGGNMNIFYQFGPIQDVPPMLQVILMFQ